MLCLVEHGFLTHKLKASIHSWMLLSGNRFQDHIEMKPMLKVLKSNPFSQRFVLYLL